MKLHKKKLLKQHIVGETTMDKIEVKSDVVVKASPDCKPIIQKAVAGVSNAELIERYTIGEYREEEEEEEQETSSD